MDLVKFTIFIVVILWIGWVLVGGPQDEKTRLPFLRPPSPIDTGETYGPASFISGQTDTQRENDNQQLEYKKAISLFGGSFALQQGNTYTEKPEEEYVVIYASSDNAQPVNITGWKLESATNRISATIGKGTYLPFSGTVSREDQIFLNPGDQAIITTGQSPNGVSFRVNACTGYFEQFQNFTPPLQIECPYPGNENLPVGPGGLNDVCIDYIESLRQCVAHIAAIPIGLSSECSEYINKNIHYNGCMQRYKNDQNFYKPEWRIFLGNNKELWKKNREAIKLLDVQGKIIDVLSY